MVLSQLAGCHGFFHQPAYLTCHSGQEFGQDLVKRLCRLPKTLVFQ